MIHCVEHLAIARRLDVVEFKKWASIHATQHGAFLDEQGVLLVTTWYVQSVVDAYRLFLQE